MRPQVIFNLLYSRNVISLNIKAAPLDRFLLGCLRLTIHSVKIRGRSICAEEEGCGMRQHMGLMPNKSAH